MAVDSTPNQKLVAYFKHLGISKELAAIYLHLLAHGPQTVLAISRGLKSGRTKLYPALEELADKQLVTVHERHYGTSYEAQPPEALEFLVAERERKSSALRSDLPAALHLLKQMAADTPNSTRIAEYRGVDGLKQMNFNLTRAEGEFRVYELKGLDKHLGRHFADKMRERYAEKDLHTYDLTNNPKRTAEPGVDLPHSQARYIDPQIFKIEFETFIYNNCVALLSYHQDDIFGVEIYNEKLAAQHKQLFDLVWTQAAPL